VRITVLPSADEVASALADRIAEALQRKPDAILGLPAGQTPVAAYGVLQQRFAEGHLDFSAVSTFNLDEFVGIPGWHSGSFRHFMEHHLLEAVNLHQSRIHFLDGMAADLAAECARYEHAIDEAGGIDLQLLGIGANGHIAFNEPGNGLSARTHVATLLPSTRRDNAALFDGDESRVPEQALTMGVGTILRSRRILLAATGQAKAPCVAAAVHGPVTTWLPASLLQLHGDVELLLDRDAAVSV
jgi:glucosamine-6-phosphate deaminase